MASFNPNDPVAKGAVTQCLDNVSARPDARDRLAALRTAIIALRQGNFRGLENVLSENLLVPVLGTEASTPIVEYLRRYWFDEATGWWPAFQPVAPIYAHGLVHALNVSLGVHGRQPLPFDSYWILGHDKVEIITLASDRQLTLLIATPAPPQLAQSGIRGVSSEAWVTGRRAGVSQQEIDPMTGSETRGGTDLRLRTFKIQSR
jgi:hypothetical protein